MIDMAQFNQRMGNNSDIINKVLQIFLDQYQQQSDLLREPIASGDPEQVYFAAHSIKGALANICADEDAAVAEQIESLAREGTMPDEALIQQFSQHLEGVYAQIKQHLA